MTGFSNTNSNDNGVVATNGNANSNSNGTAANGTRNTYTAMENSSFLVHKGLDNYNTQVYNSMSTNSSSPSSSLSSLSSLASSSSLSSLASSSSSTSLSLSAYSELSDTIYSYEVIKEIADYLLDRTEIRPRVGIICGSGLNSLVDYITDSEAFEYEQIPNFPVSTVEGHVGRMIFGYLEGVPVMAMQGRFHYYEGYPLAKCSMPVRVMKLVGVQFLMATNAAGGLNPKYKVGDIMLVRDHVNMMGFAGNSPLSGPNDPRFGPRFPPMTNAYDTNLIRMAKKVARDMGIERDVHEGVYTCLGGPNYETVAELRMLRTMGVDAVGMSTVHEVITARHCDLIVFAFSLVTNKCALDYDVDEEANHEEVVMVGKSRQSMCGDFMSRMIKQIAVDYPLKVNQ